MAGVESVTIELDEVEIEDDFEYLTPPDVDTEFIDDEDNLDGSNREIGIIPFSSIHQPAQPFDSANKHYFISGCKIDVKILEVNRTVHRVLNPNLYKIRLRHGGFEWIIYRRYKHFRQLHDQLVLFRAKLRIPVPTKVHKIRRQSMRKRPQSLPKFPRLPEAMIRDEDLEERKNQLQDYLQNVLRSPQFRNHEDTVKFLEVSQFSFVSGLGGKEREQMVKKRSGGRKMPKGLCNCCSIHDCRNHWNERWLMLKDSFVAYVHPKLGVVRDVMLMDSEFEVECGIINTGVRNGLIISNLSRSLVLKCWTQRKAEEWKRKIDEMAASKSRDYTTANRFDSFAPVRLRSHAQWFADGAGYMASCADALESAKEEIFITDWWLSPEIYMKRPITEGDKWRLDVILKRKAAQGVKIFVMVFKEMEMALGLNSYYTKQALLKLHPYNVKVLRHPNGINLWSHHEKSVIIDQRIAFLGGIDLCYGRWDTGAHKLTDLGSILQSGGMSPEAQGANAMSALISATNPLQDKVSGKDHLSATSSFDRSVSSPETENEKKRISAHIDTPQLNNDMGIDSGYDEVDEDNSESAGKGVRDNNIATTSSAYRSSSITTQSTTSASHDNVGGGCALTYSSQTSSIVLQKSTSNEHQREICVKVQGGHEDSTSTDEPGVSHDDGATSVKEDDIDGRKKKSHDPNKDTKKLLKQDRIDEDTVSNVSRTVEVDEQVTVAESDAIAAKLNQQLIEGMQRAVTNQKKSAAKSRWKKVAANVPSMSTEGTSEQTAPNFNLGQILRSQRRASVVESTETQSNMGSQAVLLSPSELKSEEDQRLAYYLHMLTSKKGPKPTTPKPKRKLVQKAHNLKIDIKDKFRKNGSRSVDIGRKESEAENEFSFFQRHNDLPSPQSAMQEIEIEGSGTKIWVGKDYTNFIFRDFVDLDQPFTDFIDRTQTPRMPWHDIGAVVYGKSARDVARHFIQRWNFTKIEKRKTNPDIPLLLPKACSKVTVPQVAISNGCQVNCQILRSSAKWSAGIDKTELSIQKAYLNAINNSKHYIYIENQFFISIMGHDQVFNQIGAALFERIKRAHENNDTFRVFIIMPLLPAFEGELGTATGTSIQAITHWNYSSMCRGGKSILERLAAIVPDPSEYLTFYGLRTHEELMGKTVCELIYVHSKLMIVDDMLTIIGSANINDRSMLGNRDSELALVIQDIHTFPGKMNGKDYKCGWYSGSLRKTLFKEHLGLSGKNSDKFDVTDPVSKDFYKEIWLKQASINTAVYDKVFHVLPTDHVRTFAELHSYQRSQPLIETNKVEALKQLQRVQGHLVMMPLYFLGGENLQPKLASKEGLAPTAVWT